MTVATEPTLDNFTRLVDPGHPALAPVRPHLEAGRRDEALEAWRDTVLVRLRRLRTGGYNWHHAALRMPDANWLVGRLDTEAYAEKTDQPRFEDVYRMRAEPGRGHRVDWTGFPDQTGDMRGKLRYNQFEFAVPLVAAYHHSGDPIYLQKFVELAADFARHQKRMMQALSPEEAAGFFATWTLEAGPVLMQGWRANNIARSLTLLAKGLPEGNRDLDWKNVGEPWDRPLRPEATTLVDAEDLFAIAASLVEDHATELVQAYVPAGYTPNQRLMGLQALLLTAKAFPEFRRASELEDAAARGFEDYLDATVLEDGGDLEQSFNYNGKLLKVFRDVDGLYPADRPAWVQRMAEAVRRRHRLFICATMPDGALPVTGTASYGSIKRFHFPGPGKGGGWQASGDPVVDAVQRAKETGDDPGFTSIAFPYTGYYVLRDGWGPDARYLWFLGCRHGAGHFNASVNSIQLAAHGRRLIVEAGSPYYHPHQAHPEDFDDFDAFREYFNAREPLRTTTVMVDGLGQRRHDLPYRVEAYTEPVPARWHTSRRFDLVEGLYEDGYGRGLEEPLPGSHVRQVVFCREAGIWLLVDRLDVPGAHTFTQTWHLPPDRDAKGEPAPGFANEHVATEENAFRTTDPEGPNLWMGQFGAACTLEKFHGARRPHKGWYSYNIVSRKVPSPDVHVSWEDRDHTLLVTAIVPSPAGEDSLRSAADISGQGAVGCALELADGTRVWLSAAHGPASVTAGPLVATATVAVCVERGNEQSGLVLDAADAALDGQAMSLPAPDFVFGGEPPEPITRPARFDWQTDDDGNPAPVYQ